MEKRLAAALIFLAWLNGTAQTQEQPPSEEPGPPPDCPPGFTPRLVEVNGALVWACCGSPVDA